ncbi:MAG: hypothetical protein HY708_05590 [Ignavibacteriae bacterium]|nr:hypothetical protein [Ignavibacteriota bacterium]
MNNRLFLFRNRVHLGIASSVLLAHSLLFAQTGKVVVIEHADSLVGKVIDGEDARELIGNVAFTQENTRVHCDRALQYLVSGNVYLSGNVTVEDDSVIMRMPRGIYFRDERKAQAFDNVSLDDGKVRLTARYGEYFTGPKVAFFRSHVVVNDTASVLFADSLTYYREERRTVAMGNVSIYNATDNVTITGHNFESITPKNYSRMTDEPVLTQVDTSSSGRIDTLVVRSMVMESYRDTPKRLIATDSVEIVRSDLAAVAGYAVFFTEGDSIILRKSPFVWYEETQISGDSINVYMVERRLRTVKVLGNAFAVSRSDSLHADRFDQLTGEEMTLRFADQALQQIDVDRRAISVYHLYEDTAANGLNKTSGDKVVMLMDEGKLGSIHVYGGVEGEYFPENMVSGREPEYALRRFLWRNDRPTMNDSAFLYQQNRSTTPTR